MRLAGLYAGRAQGHSWPNPAVGCVLVSADNRLIAVGSTQAGGRPHAEAEALLKAEQARKTADLKAGTAYVTLEPCAHKGRGPACADLLVQAGLGRIVYAVEDPDERVNGQGHERLIKGGLTVQSGLYAAINKTGLSGFLSSRRRGRPFVTTKIATSADGFISAKAGQQTWLTNEQSRRYVHDLRSRVDGLLTGIQTVLVDDPALTCRLPGGRGRTPVGGWTVICVCRFTASWSEPLLKGGLSFLHSRLIKARSGLAGGRVLSGCTLTMAVMTFQRPCNGVSKMTCQSVGEAGTKLNRSLFEAGLLDRLIHLTAPEKLTGVQGLLYGENSFGSGFPDDSAYIKVIRSSSDDQLTIWQKAD